MFHKVSKKETLALIDKYVNRVFPPVPTRAWVYVSTPVSLQEVYHDSPARMDPLDVMTAINMNPIPWHEPGAAIFARVVITKQDRITVNSIDITLAGTRTIEYMTDGQQAIARLMLDILTHREMGIINFVRQPNSHTILVTMADAYQTFIKTGQTKPDEWWQDMAMRCKDAVHHEDWETFSSSTAARHAVDRKERQRAMILAQRIAIHRPMAEIIRNYCNTVSTNALSFSNNPEKLRDHLGIIFSQYLEEGKDVQYATQQTV